MYIAGNLRKSCVQTHNQPPSVVTGMAANGETVAYAYMVRHYGTRIYRYKNVRCLHLLSMLMSSSRTVKLQPNRISA